MLLVGPGTGASKTRRLANRQGGQGGCGTSCGTIYHKAVFGEMTTEWGVIRRLHWQKCKTMLGIASSSRMFRKA